MKHRIGLTAVAFAAVMTIAACGGGGTAPAMQAGAAPEIYAFRDEQGWQVGVMGTTPDALVSLTIDGIDILPLMRQAAAASTGHFVEVDGGFYFLASTQLADDGVPALGKIVVTTTEGTMPSVAVEFLDTEVTGLTSAHAQPGGADSGRESASAVARRPCPTAVFTQPSTNAKKRDCLYGSTRCIEGKSHTGIDFPGAGNVMAFADGYVVDATPLHARDHGMGTVITLMHISGCKVFYSQYAHLASIDRRVKKGEAVRAGMIIGRAGASGYGDIDYWIKDGRGHTPHLHFETKSSNVTGNPLGVGARTSTCRADPANARSNTCWGYVSKDLSPNRYGYHDPQKYLDQINRSVMPY